jgi:ribonuclease HI
LKEIIVYTDGSCNNRLPDEERFGGWAFLIRFENGRTEYSGTIAAPTTSQRAEMSAVLNCLQELIEQKVNRSLILIHSDSAYIVNCLHQGWWQGWQEMNYLGIKNRDLWEAMLKCIKELRNYKNKVKFVKVKGHSGNRWNEVVDELASRERKTISGLLK